MAQVILSEEEYKNKLKTDIDSLKDCIANLKLHGPNGEVWINSLKHKKSLEEILTQWEEDYRLPMIRINNVFE